MPVTKEMLLAKAAGQMWNLEEVLKSICAGRPDRTINFHCLGCGSFPVEALRTF